MQHLIGKTVASITETPMAGYDTFKDVVTWTRITITFETGEEVSFGSPDIDVYDEFETSGFDEEGNPIPKEESA